MCGDHYTAPKCLRHIKGYKNSYYIICQKKASAKQCNISHTKLCRKCGYLKLAVAFNIRKVFCNGNNQSKECDKACDESYWRTPLKGETKSSSGGIVDTKVEKKATHGGNNEESCNGVSLEPERWNRVDGAEEEAEAVERTNKRAKIGCDDGEASDSKEENEEPGGLDGQVTGCNGEVGLVDLVNADVINLIDANNVAIAAEESDEAGESFEGEPPVDEMGVLEECSCDQSEGAKSSAADGVRPEEAPAPVGEVGELLAEGGGGWRSRVRGGSGLSLP